MWIQICEIRRCLRQQNTSGSPAGAHLITLLRRTILILERDTECHESLRTLQHRLVELASATRSSPGPLGHTLLDIISITSKLLIQHLLGLVTLLLRLLNLLFLFLLDLRLLKLLLD